MKTFSLSVGFLGSMLAAALADVSKEEVKKLAQAGVGDDTIVAYVKLHGPLPTLSSDDLADLKKSGVSDKVLLALISAPAVHAQAETSPSYPAGYSAGGTVPSTTTTYVYDSPGYYYPYTYPYSSYYAYPAFYPSFAFSARFGPRARFFSPAFSGRAMIRRR
jgi:hypothetical protein